MITIQSDQRHTGLTQYPPSLTFWHSGTLALSPEHQSARMSKIKYAGLYTVPVWRCTLWWTHFATVKKRGTERVKAFFL